MPTNLRAGQVAIVGYNAEDTNSPNKDTISFILLTPILSGTQIFFTDRAWNGTTFAAAGGNDGTFTYTAGADLPAGTVVQITTSQLGGAGIDLNDTGETIYVYQGAINAPATFLFAADIADGNNTFNGSLVNTGLSAAANTAVAISFDNASFAARGHDINTPVLLDSIADSNDWTGNDNSMQVAPQGSLSNAPDQEIWVAGSGGGHALIRMDRDGASFTAEDITHLLQNSSDDGNGSTFTHRLWHPTDIVFDTVHNKMFVADSDGSGHNRIVQFNISDFLANPGVAPTGIILYQDANVGVGMVGIQVDINTGHVYYAEDTHIYRLNYDTPAGSQAPGIVAHLGTNVFVQDFVLDLDVNGNGTAYIVNSAIQSNFGTDNISRNFLYSVTGITPTSTTPVATVNATQMEMEDNDQEVTGVLSFNADPQAFPKERGVIKGIDLDPVTHILYFTTQTWSADHDGNSGTPPVTQFGGVWSYATIGNAVGHYDSVFRQDGVNGPDGLIYYIEIDHASGKYYLSDTTGGPANLPDDQDLWVGNFAGGTPTQFGLAANIQGLTGLGMSIQTAPTLGGTNLNPGQTEQANNPSPNGDSPAPPVVTPANAFTASDLDTIGAAGGDNVAGAQVRISNNFLSNAVAGDDHQDILSISAPTTGSGTNGTVVLGGDTIAFVYDSSTGTMTFSGISTFANYQTVLAMVRFQATGDNPTGFGNAAIRTISYATFDGLLYSDEVHATVTVTGLNDTPVNGGLTGSYSATEDTNLALTGISVFDVDSDPANQNIVVTLSVAHGTLTLLTNVAGGIIAGQITAGANNSATITLTATQNQINATLAAASGLIYAPTADYNGTDGITVVTNDQGLNGNDPGLTGTGTSEQDSDTKTINIAAVVDIANDSLSFAEDSGTHTLAMPNNDTFENIDRAITSVTQGLHGTVTINDNGTAGTNTDDFVVYTQVADYNGADSFTYTVTSGGVTETATVNVTATAVADITADTATIAEDSGPATLDVLGNDSFENAGRFISAVTQGAHGTVTINNNNTAGDPTDDFLVYTPNADYNGSDTFNYTVTSPAGITETTSVTMTITAVADIAADSVSVAEDSGANTLDLLGNDSFENAARFISAVTQGAHGSVAINNAGTPGNTADDFVVYTVTDANYVGSDTFNYTVTSPAGVTETVAVSVNITAVNDGPINTKPGLQTINEDATVTFGGGTVISVNDIDVGAGTLTVTLSVLIGQLTLSGITGLSFDTGDGTDDATMTFTGTQANINAALNGLLYEATQDHNGSDTLTITTNDNGNTGTPGPLQDVDTVTINITAVADIANDSVTVGEDSGANNLNGIGNPVSLLANDSFENAGRSITAVTQGLHGFVSINDNNTIGDTTDDYVVYTPSGDYNGADSFTYTVTSGGVTETATVNVTVTAVADIANDAPTVNEDGGTTTIDVIANDTFENGGFSITAVTQGLHGTVAIIDGPDADLNPDYVTYTPSADYNGSDSFTYTVTSGGVTETATVNVTITAVADIVDDSVNVLQDSGTNTLNLLANDTFESAARFISAVGAALHGTTAINNAGTPGNTADDFVTYTPTGGYSGPDTFTYTVTSAGLTETATVTVNVGAPNAAPVVDLDTGTLGFDATATFAEGNGPVALGPTIEVTDADDDMIHGATIAISDPHTGDILVANLPFPGGITIDPSSTDDVMVLTGTATAEQYAAALGQIGFDNTSDDPTGGGAFTTRDIGVTVTDGISPSAPAMSTVTLFGTNDEPTLAATGLDPTYTENAAAVDLFGTVAASTVEANQTLTSLTLTVTNVTDGADEILGIDGSNVALTNNNSVTTSTHGLTVNVTVSGTTATVTFSGATLSGADLGALVDTLSYANSSENPTDANRVVTITELVDSGSNSAPNDSTTSLSIGSTVNVNPLNDAANITGDTTGDVTEAGGVGNATPGTPTDTGDLNSTDVDNTADTWQAVLAGADTTNHYGTYALSAAGVWTYTLDDSNAAVQALFGAATLTDTFSALTADGTSQLVTITIHGQDDAPTALPDAVATDEATILFGNVLNNNGSGADSDPDSGGAVTVSQVNGSGANVGMQITLLSGAHLTLNADGTFTYDPNHAFDATPGPFSGASNTHVPDSFTYTLTGGNSATVSVTIAGLDSNDALLGTPGADTLRGGIGTDSMAAGAGDDVYFVTEPGDTVFELANEGFDIVYSGTSYTLTAGAYVELLSTDSIAGTTAIDLTGNALSNTIWGNNGANTLRGGGGGDAMLGFAGDDIYFVTDASDRVLEDLNGGNDSVFTNISYTLEAGSYVELLATDMITGTAAINLTGNALSNAIWGNNGANILHGGGGGDDLVGFGGNDIYFVSDVNDRVFEELNGGNDTVYTNVTYTLRGGSSVELLAADGIGNTYAIDLTGNELSNTIWGNNGANTFRGGGGGDAFVGFGGNDIYFVTDASDRVLEDQNAGFDIVYSSVNYTLTAGASVELLSTDSIAGTTAINLTGNELSTTIWGNNGANVLNGGLGGDALIGFGGADIFAFTTALGNGNVDNILDFTSGTDKIALDDAIFGGLGLGAVPATVFHIGATATDEDQRILYDDTTGDLYYDADGNGGGAAILFATLQGHPTLTAGDFQVI